MFGSPRLGTVEARSSRESMWRIAPSPAARTTRRGRGRRSMMILTSEHCLRPIVTTTAMNTLLMAEGSYDFISFAVFEHGEITKFMQYVAFLLYLKAAVGIGMAFFLRTLSPLPKRSPKPPAVARSPVRGDHRGDEEEEGGGEAARRAVAK